MTPAIRLAATPLHARDRDSVLVPLPFLDLPRELRLCDLGWHREVVWAALAALSHAGEIGVHTAAELERACAPLPAAEAGHLSRAISEALKRL